MPLSTLLWVRRPTELLESCHRLYGGAFTLQLPGLQVVVVSDPESIRTMFAAKPDDMHAGLFNSILRVLVGSSSVLLLDGAPHMQRRKLLMPAFHGARMRLYGQTMAEITRQQIARFPRDRAFSLHVHTQEIALQVILRTVFGAREGAQLSALSHQIKRMLKGVENPLAFMPLLYLRARPDAETRLPWRYILKDRTATDAMLYAQIAARRAEGADPSRHDVLSMLLQARDEQGEGLSDSELRDELMTALAAGHETTATSLAWAMERLFMVPEVYRNLCDEVRVLGPDPDPERLAALPYLDAVIKEVLRLRPVVPMVGRVLRRPYTLAGYDMPAGTGVGVCVYLAHLNPEVYPEPERFRPERFLGVSPDPAHWLPFGGGIRRCVGAAFAMYEMKIVLGTLLSACDFEPAQAPPLRIIRRAITFWPEGGTRVRVRPARTSTPAQAAQ